MTLIQWKHDMVMPGKADSFVEQPKNFKYLTDKRYILDILRRKGLTVYSNRMGKYWVAGSPPKPEFSPVSKLPDLLGFELDEPSDTLRVSIGGVLSQPNL